MKVLRSLNRTLGFKKSVKLVRIEVIVPVTIPILPVYSLKVPGTVSSSLF